MARTCSTPLYGDTLIATLPVAKGGTGAVTENAALVTLGAAKKAEMIGGNNKILPTILPSTVDQPDNITTTAVSKTLAVGEICRVTAPGKTINLPVNPEVGDTVTVVVDNFTNTIIGRNGKTIMGVAEDLTVDKANFAVKLRYFDSWRLVS